MSKAKFTKGEWYISHWESDDYYDLNVSTKDKTEANPCGYVCSLNLAYDDEGIDIVAEQEINRANAHLISAAPEMYCLMEKLTSIEHERGGFLSANGELNYKVGDSVFKEAKRLLTKARGE